MKHPKADINFYLYMYQFCNFASIRLDKLPKVDKIGICLAHSEGLSLRLLELLLIPLKSELLVPVSVRFSGDESFVSRDKSLVSRDKTLVSGESLKWQDWHKC